MLRTQVAAKIARQALARTHTQVRGNATRALSNPMLNNIEKRWESMPLQEQAELWMALRDRMKGSWKELTVQEKKAGGSFPFFFRDFIRHLLAYRCSRHLFNCPR